MLREEVAIKLELFFIQQRRGISALHLPGPVAEGTRDDLDSSRDSGPDSPSLSLPSDSSSKRGRQ